ncbi:hypothetical protein DEO72_LG6g1374 [Vigna unguiculata]|uniref:Uncharacterized protein n=1 Tax=Vigna unguiculata TaxID=3917 RepID=A0A4D6M6Z6_VIGUN|nr:hypothetical protein DEO72_LG6g1374 [Vigna unguiculata]
MMHTHDTQVFKSYKRIGGATVAGNGERGARYSSEQSHGAAVQRLSPSVGCGAPWRSGATEARRRTRRRPRRTRERGRNYRQRDSGAQEAATEERRWRDRGRNEDWTVARRWLLHFRRWRNGGCLLFACCSVAEQDRRPKLRGWRRNRRRRGRWRGRLTEGTVGDRFAREKMMNSEGSRDLGT